MVSAGDGDADAAMMAAARCCWHGHAAAVLCLSLGSLLGECFTQSAKGILSAHYSQESIPLTQSAEECVELGYPRNASDACRRHGTVLSSRPVHYVQRTSDLLATLSFFAEVGFRVLRHEENEQECSITCNGAFENPWSKTMVGTLTEDNAYALELTYNYGVTKYDAGRHRSLVNFGIMVPNPGMIAQAAGELGYFTAPLPPVAGLRASWQDAALASTMLVIGPDDYYYTLMTSAGTGPAQRLPYFHHVSLRVSSLHHSLLFYTELLGMKQLPDAISENARAVGVAAACLLEGRPQGYADNVMSTAVGYYDDEGDLLQPRDYGDGTDLVFVLIDDTAPVLRTEWGGRNAIAVPEAAVRRINDVLLEQEREMKGNRGARKTRAGSNSRFQGKIVHPLQILEEKLGRLLILIVADPDGNEVCLVSREVFDPSALAADDFVLVRCMS